MHGMKERIAAASSGMKGKRATSWLITAFRLRHHGLLMYARRTQNVLPHTQAAANSNNAGEEGFCLNLPLYSL